MTDKDYKKSIQALDKKGKTPGRVFEGFSWRDWAELGKYILKCQRELNLEYWDIEFSHLPIPDEKSAARMEITWGTNHAFFSISSDWVDFPEPKRCYTIAHELAHLHLERVWQFAIDEAKAYMNPAQFSTYQRILEQTLEEALFQVGKAYAIILDDCPEPKG
jgi:hypothetical protein